MTSETPTVWNIAAMEPRIQYAQTADGVSIAFYTLGAGTPLAPMPTPPDSPIQFEWQWPELSFGISVEIEAEVETVG